MEKKSVKELENIKIANSPQHGRPPLSREMIRRPLMNLVKVTK